MKKYLSREVKKQIKQESPELIPSVTSVLKSWSNYPRLWVAIFLLTLIIFYLGLNINIEALNIIHINENNVRQMIENRTTNIIAIIGISFAIVGFLISNLAIKGNKSYEILFRRSLFLPITYFSLSLMVSFIALTALKDHLETNTLSRLLYVGIYLMIVDIFLIGFLFSKLIIFTNSKKLYKIAGTDFAEESKNRIYEWIKKDKSRKIINEIVPNTNPHLFWVETHCYPVDVREKPYLKDINIKKLQKAISKQKGVQQIYQNNLFLGKDLTNKNELFYSPTDLPDLFKELNSTIKLTKQLKETSSETREYIKNETLKLILADDYRSVEQLLSEYAEIVKLKYFEEVLLDEVQKDISELIHKAIECNSYESFNRIDGFIVNILMFALSEKRLRSFDWFLNLVKIYYTATKSPQINNKTARWSQELSAIRIRETIWVVDLLIEKQKNIEDIKLLNKFSYLGYQHFSDLLYSNILNNDIDCFSQNCDELNNVKSATLYSDSDDLAYNLQNISDKKQRSLFILKKVPDFYYSYCFIGIKYWLYWLYNNNKISPQTLSAFLESIKLEPNRTTPRLWEMELLFSELNTISAMTFFNWGRWTCDDPEKSGRAYFITTPMDWIFFGYAIDITFTNGISPLDGDIDLSHWGVNIYSNKKSFIINLLAKLKIVDQHIEKWRLYFNKPELTTNYVKKQLEQKEQENDLQVAEKEIEPEKEKKFKIKIQQAWNVGREDDDIPGEFDKIDFVQYASIVEEKLPLKTSRKINMDGGKRMFIAEAKQDFSFVPTFMSEFRWKLNEDILLKIIQNKEIISKEKNWDHILMFLENVIHPGYTIITDPYLAKEIKEKYPKFTIKTSDSFYLKNTIILADIKSAFDIRIAKDTKGNVPRITLATTTKEQAKTIYDQYPEYWSDNNQISETTIITKLMSKITVDVQIDWDIQIKDPSAYIVLYLNP